MKRAAVAVLFVAVFASRAFAWNSLGHKVVAEIAWRQLDPPTRQQIVDTLRRHPRFDKDFVGEMEDDALKGDKATQDHWIFQHAATWPDIARGLPAGERSKYDRPLWHYVDFPLYLDQADRRSLGKLPVNLATDYTAYDDKKKFNVLQAIKYCRTALASKAGPETKALAYCWLMHLVGDIHQPLHSTALFSVDRFPEGDRGGNEIPLAKGKNLHSLWDNLLSRQFYMRNVTKAVAELSDRKRFPEWESAGKELDGRKWADESHNLCESFVYDPVILNAVRNRPAGAELDKIELPETYYKAAGEHARHRIVAAGVRLGSLLKTLNRP